MRPLLLVVCALTWLTVAPAVVEAQAQSAPTRLIMSEPARGSQKGHLTLRATLVAADGKALGTRQIAFYEASTVFGPRDVLLGSATTDSTGFVEIDYQAAQVGKHTIVARFNGDDQYAATDTSSAIDVREAIAMYEPDPLPLASVRQWLPVGLASLVLATWAVLLGVAVRTVLGVRSAGRKQEVRGVGSALTAPEGSSS